ncbi:hypothetical protein SDC9_190438 [bioreactor metagenome]|uniref:Uncharacterized protein n=1 Tax=bioreactor metagenome TaxID=1076179 RepID=A0A645HVK2_9ZZZZ
MRAAELLAIEPEKCMVIEDSGSGILAAKRAGMQCTAYLSAPEGQVDYHLADYRISHFDRFFETVTVMD